MESLRDKSKLPPKYVRGGLGDYRSIKPPHKFKTYARNAMRTYLGRRSYISSSIESLKQSQYGFLDSPPEYTLNEKIIKTNPDINAGFIEYLDAPDAGADPKYVIYVKNDNTLIVTIYDQPLDEIQRQLATVNIKTSIEEARIVIRGITFNDYYVLGLILERLPTWEDLTDLKVNTLEYFLENNPEFAVDYITRYPSEILRFAELVKDEPSYFDIIINKGVDYLGYAVKNLQISESKRMKSIIAHVLLSEKKQGKLSEDNIKMILRYLLEGEVTPEDQRLINQLFIEYSGLPLGSKLAFDVKLDTETIFKLGKMITRK